MPDLAERFPQNPILVPQDIAPSRPDLSIECLLNPGAFRFDHKTWLLLRVAERPTQVPGKTIVPIFRSEGGMELLEFDHDDPKLDRSDPRVYRYDGVDYLTTISHLRTSLQRGRHSLSRAGSHPSSDRRRSIRKLRH